MSQSLITTSGVFARKEFHASMPSLAVSQVWPMFRTAIWAMRLDV
jgi:hypothetical protein